MPPFYFHLFNDFTNHDDEGTELPNAAVAMEAAARMAREMAAESVREGRLVLQHRIEVTDERYPRRRELFLSRRVNVTDRQFTFSSSAIRASAPPSHRAAE